MLLSQPGLVAAPFTPIRPEDGSVDLGKVPSLVASLVRNDVKAAFINGSTGESTSLTSAERRATAAAWREASPAALKLIVHVGHLAILEARNLAAHNQSIGADDIATFAPCFFKPAGVPELVAWCREIAAAAPRVPFYYYHIPSLTGVSFPVAEVLQQARGQIPTLAGVKFTFEDLDDFSRCLEIGEGKLEMLYGRDEKLLFSLHKGAHGAVGTTYNFAAPLFNRILAAHTAGDEATAAAEQQRAIDFIDVLVRFRVVPAAKSIMKMIGLDCGPVRLPLFSLPPDQEAALRDQLDAIGFFTYTSQP